MREIIQHKSTNRDLLDVEHARGLRQMLQRRVIRMEGQRDEGLEAVGFVLQRAQRTVRPAEPTEAGSIMQDVAQLGQTINMASASFGS